MIDAMLSVIGFGILFAIVWIALNLEKCGATSIMLMVCAP